MTSTTNGKRTFAFAMDATNGWTRLPAGRGARSSWAAVSVLALGLGLASPVAAAPFSFSTGNPDGKIGTGSRPDSSGKVEIESADDFLLSHPTSITGASFTGLLSGVTAADIKNVIVEIYRVFPKDSTNPPSGKVPTRVNSPSDVAFTSRDGGAGELSFSTAVLSNAFAVSNSVLNGINPSPNQKTGGEGAVTGQEVRFDISFDKALELPADHYFFIPQVALDTGEFYWLSAPKPIVAPGTPFTPDLQSWIRNGNLDPDWLRIGTDIVGAPAGGGAAPTFNAAFSLTGATIAEPSTLALALAGLAALGWGGARRSRPAAGI